MINRLTGNLVKVKEDIALVENNGLTYEVMLPSALAEKLRQNGTPDGKISFETIYYIEAGDKKSSHFPRLVGFTDPVDREFFSLLCQVPGMGIKKALKSLVMPIRDIATAIETKDATSLNRLPGVGGRMAEKIIAELNGKTTKFALSRKEEPLAIKEKKKLSPVYEDAIEVLVQLQYKRNEAVNLVEDVRREKPDFTRVEDLITFIFKREQNKKVAIS